MKSKQFRVAIKTRKRRDAGAAKISPRVVVFFVASALVLGAIAISLNLKLEEQEGTLLQSASHR